LDTDRKNLNAWHTSLQAFDSYSGLFSAEAVYL
jgi:hypothetical protein